MSRLVGRLGTLLGLRVLPLWVGDFLMATFAALAWAEPTGLGEGVPEELRAVFFIEGLAIHATPFALAVMAGYLPRWILWIYAPFLLAGAVFISTPLLVVVFIWHLAAAAWSDRMTEGDFNLAIVRYVMVAVLFLVLMFVLYALPVPELGWHAGAVPQELAWERGDGVLLYQGLPAFLTIYFTLRALWHIYWRYLEKTGGLAVMSDAMAEAERKAMTPPRRPRSR